MRFASLRSLNGQLCYTVGRIFQFRPYPIMSHGCTAGDKTTGDTGTGSASVGQTSRRTASQRRQAGDDIMSDGRYRAYSDGRVDGRDTDAGRDLTQDARDLMRDAGDAVGDVGRGVGDAARDLGNGAKNAARDITGQ